MGRRRGDGIFGPYPHRNRHRVELRSGAGKTRRESFASREAALKYMRDLRAELAEAERCHDRGREEQAREEIEALTQQLAAAMGLGGRDRSAGSAAERARSTVSQRLRAVFQRIAIRHPGLADHLAARVRTGTFCAYQPDPERPVVWDLGPSGHG